MVLEGLDLGVGRAAQLAVRVLVVRDQVDLGGHARHQGFHAGSVVQAGVEAVHHHVLEGDALAGGERELPAGLEELVERVLAGDGHHL
ncbi:MAG: hypothetical protein ACK559_38780, partial [bacterium]